MTTRIRKITAPTLQQAIQRARQELGEDVMIIDKRSVRAGGLRGLLGGRSVELRVAFEEAVTGALTGLTSAGPRLTTPAPLRPATPATVAELEQLVAQQPPVPSQPDPLSAPLPPDESAAPDHQRLVRLEHRLEEMMDTLVQLSQQPGAAAGGVPPGTWTRITTNACRLGLDPQLLEARRSAWEPELVGTPEPEVIFKRLLASALTVREPLQVSPGQARIIALIGPTGVGKTTTLAKLASSLGLPGQGLRIGMLSADVYRLAAVDQLRRYAEILHAPLEIVHTPADVAPALDRLGACDAIFVDTAGRSPRDDDHLRDLRACLQAIPEAEVHLVLSSTDEQKYLEYAWQAFSMRPPDSLIFTKLDESLNYAALINTALKTGIPLSYYTTGQRVPEDIEHVQAHALVDLVVTSEDQEQVG